ncbi:hypothetical protein ACFZAV_45305 [Streptomyces sp. NPDC008343]|uniref:hypothetical protein n=1 Tax=Streptomyces sp. NPDC008343 TaxID=3364828 RepID=UPI0036E79CDC
MSAISAVLRDLYDGESDLVQSFLSTAERHPSEHEVHHVATDLARWSREHADRIARVAGPHGLHLPHSADDAPPGRPPILRGSIERPAPALGETPEPDLSLLHDLCELHLAATGNSLNWEILAQAAQATGDGHLLDLSAACHPQTLRQMRWTNTMIKTLSPQLLSTATGSERAASPGAGG